ncbi:MAG: zf-HC2 domain-containing protein [Actinobacteria bacterium]|nr:zf-HC2 domain-containing protein [Actinomycetota bacterium]
MGPSRDTGRASAPIDVESREGGGSPIDAGARRRAAVETFAQQEASLRRAALRYSICADDAEDALQRGLEILLTKAPSGDARELVRWTHTVVKHEALAVRAERERLLAGPAAATTEPGREDWVAMLPAEVAGPAERAERHEAIERSREALATLKAPELRALGLLAEGYSYREIAAITGFSTRKVNRSVAEGRERFRRFLLRREGGARCAELAPVLSAFADGEAAATDVATLRDHLRTCGHCRRTLRAYRAVPGAAAALLPVLPPPRGALVGRLHDAYAAVATRLGGGGSGASDSTLGGLAAAGGTRGAGMAALAKVLAICAGTVGGAACLATGIVPAPLLDAPERQAPAHRVAHHRARPTAQDAVVAPTTTYEPAPPTATEVEAEPQPEETGAPSHAAEKKAREAEEQRAAASVPPASESGAVEYTEPAPVEAASPSSTSSAASSGGGAGGSTGGAAGGNAAGEFGP